MIKRLKFKKTVEYVQNNPADNKTYEEGKEYDIDNTAGHADRWLRRGVAEEVHKVVESKAPGKDK